MDQVADEGEVVFEFKKNTRDCVRAILKSFQGKRVLDLRVHYYVDAVGWKPGNKGLCLQVDQIHNLKTAVEALEARINAEAPK